MSDQLIEALEWALEQVPEFPDIWQAGNEKYSVPHHQNEWQARRDQAQKTLREARAERTRQGSDR